MNRKSFLSGGLGLLMLLQLSLTQAQVGNTFCDPVPIGVLPGMAPFSFSDNNFGSGSEPDIWPDCGGGNNTRFYFFRLPPGFTNLSITLDPQETRAFQIALLDSAVCLAPGPERFVPGSDACGTPGASISLPPLCLNAGGGYILKVSGMLGNYQLTFQAEAPSCSDGCVNGTETGVDSVAAPPIFSSTLDSSSCAGDLVLLQVGMGTVFTSIIWDDGSTGVFRTVNKPGDYSASVVNSAGCSALARFRLFYDADCVWPGDADLNRRVQARDVLPIGLAYNRTGPGRPMPGIGFEGQTAPDWPLQFTGIYEGINFKHADADGNGAINELDIDAIRVNYGLEVPSDFIAESGRSGEWARSGAGDPPLFVVFESDSVEAGDTLRGTVHAGTALEPVSDLYGYSFELELPMAFLDSSFFELDFSPSWLDDDGDVSGFYQFVSSQGFVDIGYSRTDQTARTGSGPLFDFGVIVVDNLDGARVTQTRQLPFDFDELIAVDPGADSVFLRAIPDTATALEYCDSRGLSSASEYIDAFRVNSKTVNSGNNGGYRHLVVNSNYLRANTSYTFGFRPGFSGAPVDQHWRAWLDINADGDFNDPGELLVNRVGSNLFQRSITVPDTAHIGWTYLRVQMKRFDGIAPEACEPFAFGEVEDFFVEIRPSGPRYGELSSGKDDALLIWPNPAQDRFRILAPNNDPFREIRLIRADGALWIFQLNEGQEALSGSGWALDVGAMPEGWYAVQLIGAERVYSGRLLLQR